MLDNGRTERQYWDRMPLVAQKLYVSSKLDLDVPVDDATPEIDRLDHDETTEPVAVVAG